MADDFVELERQLEKLEAKALLHGRTEAIEGEISSICRALDELEMGAGEDWLMERDREMGRAYRPLDQRIENT